MNRTLTVLTAGLVLLAAAPAARAEDYYCAMDLVKLQAERNYQAFNQGKTLAASPAVDAQGWITPRATINPRKDLYGAAPRPHSFAGSIVARTAAEQRLELTVAHAGRSAADLLLCAYKLAGTGSEPIARQLQLVSEQRGTVRSRGKKTLIADTVPAARVLYYVLLVVPASGGSDYQVQAAIGDAPAAADALPAANRRVLEHARGYANGGGYCWNQWRRGKTPEPDDAWWRCDRFSGAKETGAPEVVRWKTRAGVVETYAKDGRGTTFCSGFTLAVAAKAGSDVGLFDGLDKTRLWAFGALWHGWCDETAFFGAHCKGARRVFSPGALEHFAIGRAIAEADALPGDFAQLPSHSVIVTGFLVDGGRRVALQYRSSQPSTDGIGDITHCFAGETCRPECKRADSRGKSWTYCGLDRTTVAYGRLNSP